MPTHRRAQASHPAVHLPRPAEPYDFDAEPCEPTLEEIEIADELRHDLELKYLGKADPCRETSWTHWRQGTDLDDWD